MGTNKTRKDSEDFKRERRIYGCSFNPGCACEKRQCATCGWNPVVSEARTQVILKRMNGEG